MNAHFPLRCASVRHAAVVCLILGAGFGPVMAETRVEARQQARVEAVQRAGVERSLSKEMPQSVQELPCFGAIQWTIKELPFVEKGPHGGISGMGMVVVDERIGWIR